MKVFAHGDSRVVLSHVVHFGKIDQMRITIRFSEISKPIYVTYDTEKERDNAFNRMEAEIESIS